MTPEKPKPVERGPDGRIVKGSQSLNPGGRSKIQEEIKELLANAGPHAAKRLIEMMDSPDDDTAFRAINSTLDRVCGKARESVEVSGDGLSDLLRALVVAKPPDKP